MIFKAPFTRADATRKPLLDEAQLQALYRRAHSAPSHFQHPFVEQHQAGDVASRFRGAGMDYEESRIYQQGDDPRFINWRVTARAGEAHTKQFREETRPGVFILVDRRTSMRFGTHQRIKAAQACRLAALVSFAAVQQGWSVSGLLLDDKAHWFPTSVDSHSIWQFVRDSAAACPPKGQGSGQSLVAVLPQIQNRLVRGNHVYLISDFADLSDKIEPYLLEMVNSHPVFSLHVVDPVELALPNVGQLILQDMAGEATQQVDLSDMALRKQFKIRARKRQENIRQQLHACSYFQVLTQTETPEMHIPLPHGLGR